MSKIDILYVNDVHPYSIDAHGAQTFEIYAPPGQQILSVGCSYGVLAPGQAPVLQQSEPGSGAPGVEGPITSWQLGLMNNSDDAVEGSISVYAVCTDA